MASSHVIRNWELVIIGLGIDLVDIPRFEKVCKNPLFIQKYFAKGEWDLPIQSLAGRFAARYSRNILGSWVRTSKQFYRILITKKIYELVDIVGSGVEKS